MDLIYCWTSLAILLSLSLSVSLNHEGEPSIILGNQIKPNDFSVVYSIIMWYTANEMDEL
jgi:hypothetical protein